MKSTQKRTIRYRVVNKDSMYEVQGTAEPVSAHSVWELCKIPYIKCPGDHNVVLGNAAYKDMDIAVRIAKDLAERDRRRNLPPSIVWEES